MFQIIGEAGSNHNGNFNRALALIDTAVNLKLQYVKFQLFSADTLFSSECVKERKKARQAEVPKEWLPNLYNYAHSKGIKIGYSIFHEKFVDISKPFTDFLKISSFDILRLDLIEKCLSTRLPLMLSLGLVSKKELSKLFNLVSKKEQNKCVFFHCVSKYPAFASDCNFCLLKYYIKNFPYEFGWSDHTKEPGVILKAIEYGASFIEIHFDLPDLQGLETHYGHCWEPNNIRELKRTIEIGQKAIGKCISMSKKFKEQRKHLAWPLDGLRHKEEPL